MTVPSAPALIQIGQTALRAPDGSFLPAVPLFVLVDGSSINPATGLTAGEEKAATDFGNLVAGMKQLQALSR